MSWNKVIGHKRISNFLKNAIKSQRISHAYLLVGPDGVGKSFLALQFAKALNCLEDSGDSCDRCTACSKIDNTNHPDIYQIEPETKAGSIKIAQIREIQNKIYLKPYEGKRKVFIIREAGQMTEEAQNALLKVLEEPPADSILILVASTESSLLPTIVSRCQRIKFSNLGKDEVADILIRKFATDRNAAQILAYLSEGRLGAAISMKQHDVPLWREKILNGLLNQASGSLEQDFEEAQKEYQLMGLDILSSWYRDVLVCKVGTDSLSNIDRIEKINEEARRLSVDDIEKTLDGLSAAFISLKKNANPKLVFSVLIQKLRG